MPTDGHQKGNVKVRQQQQRSRQPQQSSCNQNQLFEQRSGGWLLEGLGRQLEEEIEEEIEEELEGQFQEEIKEQVELSPTRSIHPKRASLLTYSPPKKRGCFETEFPLSGRRSLSLPSLKDADELQQRQNATTEERPLHAGRELPWANPFEAAGTYQRLLSGPGPSWHSSIADPARLQDEATVVTTSQSSAHSSGLPSAPPIGHPPEQYVLLYETEDEGDEDDLLRLIEGRDWPACLQRIVSHPKETASTGIQGRTPLHVACDNDAPAFVVRALLSAYPEALTRIGTSLMNPLHITCSSAHASAHIVRVLLSGCADAREVTATRDVDGDTPLHTACRCGAPIDVLLMLLQSDPRVVGWRDHEGLTPLLRLWVRYYVILGEGQISTVSRASDLTSDLLEAWQKTMLLLQFMHETQFSNTHTTHNFALSNLAPPLYPTPSLTNPTPQNASTAFRAVHAAASVDCPRCVLRIAMAIFPQELLARDERGRLPIHIAASTPIYPAHNLSGEGYSPEDAIYEDVFENSVETNIRGISESACQRCHSQQRLGQQDYAHFHDDDTLSNDCRVPQEPFVERTNSSVSPSNEPSVIQTLLVIEPRAAQIADLETDQYPLHMAIQSGKVFRDGIDALVAAYPEALSIADKRTNLFPFMLAATTARSPKIHNIDRDAVDTIYQLLRAAPELVQSAILDNDNINNNQKQTIVS